MVNFESMPVDVDVASCDPANLFGRYIRISPLGQGGMGDVWKAWDSQLQRYVALKFLRFEVADQVDRLRREAEAAGQLNHPNIAAVFELGQAQGKHFIAMALVDGEPLHRYVAGEANRRDRRKLIGFLRQAALAMSYAHARQLVHRDIKPENIMIARTGEHVYIMDFGIARLATATLTSTSAGTPPYMSPEQIRGSRVDARTDVWSLGATLYELMADHRPFDGASAAEVQHRILEEDPRPLKHVDPDLRTVVMKCLEKDPAARYATAQELADDLGRYLAGEAISAHPPSILYRIRKFFMRGRAALFAAWVSESNARRENEKLLHEEQEKGVADLHAREQARLHLDRGRVIEERLFRLVCADVWERDVIQQHARQAQEQFDLALAAYAKSPEAKLEKARTLRIERYVRKDLSVEAAIKLTQEAIDLSPEYVTAHLEHALLKLEIYENLRHVSGGGERPSTGPAAVLAGEIDASLKKVETWSKDVTEIQLAKAVMRFVNGASAEAAQALEDYSRTSVSDFRGWAWAGHAWQHVPGQEGRAMECLSAALRFGPKLPSFLSLFARARMMKADALASEGKTSDADQERMTAVAELTHALGQDPADQVARTLLGITQYLRGQLDPAIENLDKATAANPKDPFAREFLEKALSDRTRAGNEQRDPRTG